MKKQLSRVCLFLAVCACASGAGAQDAVVGGTDDQTKAAESTARGNERGG